MPNLTAAARVVDPHRARVTAILRSRAAQAGAALLSVALIAALHAANDGLWFQGDSPRHAANGLFWWDLLRALPSDPVSYTLTYYARYPIIAPLTYPPLFYLIEGLVFSLTGASPFAAKALVLVFAAVAALYTTAWARRWIDPAAGWAGAILPCLPGMVVWSNTVMLNVPATALGLACLYHFRRWAERAAPGPDLESSVSRGGIRKADESKSDREVQGRRTQLVLTIGALGAALLTYYQSAAIVLVCAVWVVFLRGRSRVHAPSRYVAIAVGLAVVPFVLSLYFAPVQAIRHLPSPGALVRLRTWTYYWSVLPQVVGALPLALAAASLIVAVGQPSWRTELKYIGSWIAVLLVGFSIIPAKDPRYVLLVAPAFALLIAIGAASILQRLPGVTPGWKAAMLAVCLGAAFAIGWRVEVPRVSGLREVAGFLRQNGRGDAVLYDGRYEGVFGFYVRALDPSFEQRVVRADELIYQYAPTTTFRSIERSRLTSEADVADAIRTRCGCRWVALEAGPYQERLASQRLLRQTVRASGVELVRSFALTATDAYRVDLYRVLGTVTPPATVDLTFPSFSTRVYAGVAPITR
jgi:hypothetical protein